MNNLDEFIKKAEMGELSDDDLERVSGGLSNEEIKSRCIAFTNQLKKLTSKYTAEGKSRDEIVELVREASLKFRAELKQEFSDSLNLY